jgi:hypothetical protein
MLEQFSVCAGAVIAGASEDDVKACEVYANKIGLAFQSKSEIIVIEGLDHLNAFFHEAFFYSLYSHRFLQSQMIFWMSQQRVKN